MSTQTNQTQGTAMGTQTHAPIQEKEKTQRFVEIKIARRERPDAPQRWETFQIPYRPNLNIISCLMEIRKNPVTKEGTQTTPPVWDMNCLSTLR